MHIVIDSVAHIAKGFTQKREKKADDTEAVIGHLKFADCFVTREVMDEMFRLPIGWTQASLFDEFGIPLVFMDISLPRFEAMLTGIIEGIKPVDKLTLANGTIGSVQIMLTKLGGILSGEICWEIAGDESAILVPLQGNDCRVSWVLQNVEQPDMFKSSAKSEAQRLVDGVQNGVKVTIQTGNTDVTIDKTGGETVITDVGGENDDALRDKALDLLIEHGSMSIARLQRYLQIGYNRAARLLERLETEGMCTSPDYGHVRQYIPSPSVGDPSEDGQQEASH